MYIFSYIFKLVWSLRVLAVRPWRSVSRLEWLQRSYRRCVEIQVPHGWMFSNDFILCEITFSKLMKLILFLFFSAPRQGHRLNHREKEGEDLICSAALCTFMNVHSLIYDFVFQRGKTVPEELVRAEDLGKYRQVASHAVSSQ